MTQINLRALLPPLVSGMAGIRDILDALSPEITNLDAAAYDACRQLAASTADQGLSLWERELGLYPRSDLAEAERRALVLGALSFFGPCTPEALLALFTQLTGERAAYSEAPAQYTVSLAAKTPGRIIPNLPAATQVVARKAPAHLVCHISAEGDMAAAPTLHHALHSTVILVLYAN